ncbi:TniB family NTP-binding protein [Cupriavidus necator]|uniref:TniB family NTP-binding protein n=1 Tax=Cupriavidus necator TaxID=106590 RepID=UPI003F73AEE9
MPQIPEQLRFYSSLFFELGAPFSAATRLSPLEKLSRELLRKVSARMLGVNILNVSMPAKAKDRLV